MNKLNINCFCGINEELIIPLTETTLTLSNCNHYDYFFIYNESQTIISIYNYNPKLIITYNLTNKIIKIRNGFNFFINNIDNNINFSYNNNCIIFNNILKKYNKLISLQ